MTVNFSGANAVIYAVTAETSFNRLISLTDTGASSVVTTLATCPNNELFRAVKFAPILNPFPAPSLGAPALADGQFTFSLTGVAGYKYVIESSSDLTNWLPLQTNTTPSTITPTNTANFSQVYFRAVYFP